VPLHHHSGHHSRSRQIWSARSESLMAVDFLNKLVWLGLRSGRYNANPPARVVAKSRTH